MPERIEISRKMQRSSQTKGQLFTTDRK